MSLDPAAALQKAVRDRLFNATDAGSNVFDRAPQSNPFPRIMIGESQGLAVNDGRCRLPTETFLDVHIYSRQGGYMQAKEIKDQVRVLLDGAADDPAFQALVIGHGVSMFNYQGDRTLRDPDEKTSHIAMTFHVFTEPAP